MMSMDYCDLIDTLIGIRHELAKEEGMEDWENESAGPLDSLSSAFIQEVLWYVDGDRDTWGEEPLTCNRPILACDKTVAEVKRLREIEREWKQMWSKLEDYPDICAELIRFMESDEE